MEVWGQLKRRGNGGGRRVRKLQERRRRVRRESGLQVLLRHIALLSVLTAAGRGAWDRVEARGKLLGPWRENVIILSEKRRARLKV